MLTIQDVLPKLPVNARARVAEGFSDSRSWNGQKTWPKGVQTTLEEVNQAGAVAFLKMSGCGRKTLNAFRVVMRENGFNFAPEFAPAKYKKSDLPRIASDLADALENLVSRFPLEGYGLDNRCKCLQYEDNGNCRHIIAQQALQNARDYEQKWSFK